MPAGERRRPAGCPSNLTLDELSAGELTGPEHAPVLHHVERCADCRERLVARQADPVLAPDQIRFRPLLVATDGQPVARPAAKPPLRRRRRPWVTAAGLCAGAAALGLVLWNRGADRPGGPAGDLTKGSLALTIHIKRAVAAGLPETIEAVNGEGRLRAGEEMRFTVAMARAGYAVIVGLDAEPSVTTYVPAASAPPVRVEPPGPVTLPGSVIADETAGFERVVAIVCEAPPSPEALRGQAAAALAKAGGHPEAVTSLGTGCAETSVLLRKDPR